MKKISRFRKWLIHKLGGLTPSEYALIYEKIPLIKSNKVDLKEIKTKVIVPEISYLNYSNEYIEEHVMKLLKEDLIKQLKPTIIKSDSIHEGRIERKMIYTGIIKVASENVKVGWEK